jgi:ferredoxin
MADKNNKGSKNIAGKYYVDSECIGCGMCHEIAPDHFKIDENEGIAYVYTQPSTKSGLEVCAEAMNSCPVEAIGDDGE